LFFLGAVSDNAADSSVEEAIGVELAIESIPLYSSILPSVSVGNLAIPATGTGSHRLFSPQSNCIFLAEAQQFVRRAVRSIPCAQPRVAVACE
jgi:hypothetical protein